MEEYKGKYKDIRCLSITGEEKNVEEILRDFNNQFSSANIKFLLGSGCSSKAIKPCGNIEEEINKEQDEPKRNEKIIKFKNNPTLKERSGFFNVKLK